MADTILDAAFDAMGMEGRMSESFIWVRCGDCEHRWIAVHLPMTVEKAAAIVERLICPKCAETGKIYMCEGV